jgi:hypothetical protein
MTPETKHPGACVFGIAAAAPASAPKCAPPPAGLKTGSGLKIGGFGLIGTCQHCRSMRVWKGGQLMIVGKHSTMCRVWHNASVKSQAMFEAQIREAGAPTFWPHPICVQTVAGV